MLRTLSMVWPCGSGRSKGEEVGESDIGGVFFSVVRLLFAA